MSEDNKPESGGRSRVIRMLGRVLLYGFLILILLAELAPMFFGFIEVTVTLGTGWWFFLKRTVPRIVWNWDLVGMSFVCVVLILMGAQWFLNSIAQGVQRAWPLKNAQWRWPWKFTWCGLAIVAVFFLVGMAVGGIAHQVGWMASSPEPMFEAKRNSFVDINDMRHLDGAWQQAKLETKGNLEEMRRIVWGTESGVFRGNLATRLREAYHLLLIVESDGKIRGAIIFPRDVQRRFRVGCLYSYADEGGLEGEQKLAGLIARHRDRLVAL